MAPPPKPPGTRRRERPNAIKWRTFAAAPRTGATPPLPARRPGWSPSTRAYWRRLWRSPMSAAYLEADLGALYRLAELVEQHARGELAVSGLTAIQSLEDRFGLTPRSRQILQWQVLAQGEAAPTPAAAAEVVLAPKGPQPSSVRRLRAVDPQATTG